MKKKKRKMASYVVVMITLFLVAFHINLIVSTSFNFCENNEFHLSISAKCVVLINESLTYQNAKTKCLILKSSSYSDLLMDLNSLDVSEVVNLSLIAHGSFSTWSAKNVYKNNASTTTKLNINVTNGKMHYQNVTNETSAKPFFCESHSLASSLSKTNYNNLQFEASSVFTYPKNLSLLEFQPQYSRVDTGISRGTYYGKGWCSVSSKMTEYLEIDLRGIYILTGILIQSGAVMNCSYQVDTYTIEVFHQNKWYNLLKNTSENGSFFTNNKFTITWLENPVVVNKVRIFPKTHSSSCVKHEKIFCMRLDFNGKYIRNDFIKLKLARPIHSFIESTWPDGSYGISMKPNICPGSTQKAFLLRYTKMVQNNISGLFLTPVITPNATVWKESYCLHKSSEKHSNVTFPPGAYCINKFKDGCPNNFIPSYSAINASVLEMFGTETKTFRDKDFSFLNLTTLRQDYCCRNDTRVSNSTNETFQFLSPFYLFPITNTCTDFKGYFSKLETLSLEEEHLPFQLNQVSPYHEISVDNSSYLITYFYCLYQPNNPIDQLVAHGPLILHDQSEFALQIIAYSAKKIARYSMDSTIDIQLNPVNLTCKYLTSSAKLSEGVAVIYGKMCSGGNSSKLEFIMNTSRGVVLKAGIDVAFSRNQAIIIAHDSLKHVVEENRLLLNQSVLEFVNYKITNSEPLLFSDKLLSNIDSIVILNPQKKLNKILSFVQSYDIPSFIYEIDKIENFREVDQVRYASMELSNYILPVLAHPKLKMANRIVIYRAPGVLTLFEFFALFKTDRILFRDVIIQAKNDQIQNKDVDFLASCRDCSIFLFLDSQRTSLLLNKLIKKGYTAFHGYQFFSFSSRYVIANTFTRPSCQEVHPPCHLSFKSMWNIFYEASQPECFKSTEVSNILSQPIINLTELVSKQIPSLFFNDVVNILDSFINQSTQNNSVANTKNLLAFVDSTKCMPSGSGLQLTVSPITKETLSSDPYGIMCQPGWFGKQCDSPVCSTSSCKTSHGTCIAPETCNCDVNWYGRDCTGNCKISCINGVCNDGIFGDGKCKSCDWLYLGDYCTDMSIIYGFIAAGIGTTIVTLFFVCYIVKFLQTQEQTAEAITEATETDNTLAFEDLEFIEDVEFEHKITYKHIYKKLKYVTYKKGALFSGQEIFMKSYHKAYFTLSLGLKTEIKQLGALNHNNIEKLLGVMINQSTVAIVTNIASMGSLYDVLHEKHIPITWDVKYSIMQDISRGMAYLHDVVHIEHGRLKSTNCLLHQGWLVKLTDIGLRKIKAQKREKKAVDFAAEKNKKTFTRNKSHPAAQDEDSDYRSLLWTAPEFISFGANNLDQIIRFTPHADVYSFGIIISEIVSRRPPYSDVTVMTIPHIVQVVGHLRDPILNLDKMNSNKDENNKTQSEEKSQNDAFRPVVEESLYPSDNSERTIIRNLMENCWSDIPDERPPFAYCLEVLELITPLKGNQTVKRAVLLERETESLEQYISYDTKQIFKEKDKYSDLLSRILPLTIAQQLHRNEVVKPQFYDSVTIMVYRISNIQEIMSKSNAAQTIAVIDYVHRAVDMITQARNLKVIEIDSSNNMNILGAGLPETNGTRHANEIATLATRLLTAIRTFKLSHLPESRIMLRFGIHTGSVNTGIVYRSNTPTYFVLGNAIDYAIVLESESSPNCIHASKTTVSHISHNEFDITGRTSYKLKLDKQILKTYWLNER